jgi:hypothetical protein
VYGISNDDAFQRVEAFIKENSGSWRLPDPAIKYEDPICRMAYMYMNVAVHARLVEHAIAAFPQLVQTIRQKTDYGEELRVCALGGGPGSELLGLVRYIQRMGVAARTTFVDFTLVDLVKEWDESWHALKIGVDLQLKDEYGPDRSRWPIQVSRSFLPLDATSATSFANFATRFNDTDLFLVCYLASELKSQARQFADVLDLLLTRARSGSFVLFVDRDEREVRDAVQMMIENSPLMTPLGLTKDRGRLEDDLTELEEWYIHMPSLPRRRWLAFFSLAQRKG